MDEKTLAKALETAEQLKALVREANGIVKDMNRLNKEMRAVVREQAIDVIQQEIDHQITVAGVDIKRNTAQVKEQVVSEFRKLADIALGRIRRLNMDPERISAMEAVILNLAAEQALQDADTDHLRTVANMFAHEIVRRGEPLATTRVFLPKEREG